MLTSNQLAEHINASFFAAMTNPQQRIHELERNIYCAKATIFDSLREIENLRHESSDKRLLDADRLETFLENHPGVTLQYSEDGITLLASCQSVCFHTARGEKYGKDINNDIIYFTLPIYNFKLRFTKSGNVSGQALPPNSPWIGKPFHPHAQRSTPASKSFSTMCQGNNRFIDEFSNLVNSGKLDGAGFLDLVRRAVIWLTSVHIGDTYGNSLGKPTRVPEFPAEDGNLFVDIMNGVRDELDVHFLRNARDRLDDYSYNWLKHILWFYAVESRLRSWYGSGDLLGDAVMNDVNVFNEYGYRVFSWVNTGPSSPLCKRADPVLCREKLASWRYASNAQTFGEKFPELFIDMKNKEE